LLFSEQCGYSRILNIIAITGKAVRYAVKDASSLGRKRQPKLTQSIKLYAGKPQCDIKMHTAFYRHVIDTAFQMGTLC